jgi:Copper transport outer membrane protein, MctB
MISFRFHVVSITAIFLAIAIGVVVGTTFIDRVTVNSLETRIDVVEDRADATREENNRLEAELDRNREYVQLSADFAVTDRLTDVPVLLVAARGIDEGVVERTVALARRAGGEVPGVVWLEPRWAAESEEDLEALSDIVGGSPTDDREDLWDEAWSAVADELSGGAIDDGTFGPGPDQTTSNTALEELTTAGFLTVDPLDDDTVALEDLAGTDPRVLVVSGAGAEEQVVPVVPVAVAASADAGLVTVAADVYVEADEAPSRGSELLDTYDEAVRELIVLVDHADIEEGRVASVLALDSAADEGGTGVHYGYGEGADAVLPAWTPP